MEIDIEQRVLKARQLHNEGLNCAQSVVMAYADLLDMKPEVALATAAPFGRGLAKMNEVCGCVTGMALLSQVIAPVRDRADMMMNHNLVKSMADEFREENGDIVCRRLLGLEESGIKKKPCNEYVACAARIFGRKLKLND